MSSSKNNAVEIIIEDQGTNPVHKVATPQNEERMIASASSGKRVLKSGKDKLISILSKKEQQSRRQTIDNYDQRRQSEYNATQEKLET